MNKIRYLIAASVSFSLHASMLFGIEDNKETLFTTSQNQASVSLSFASMPAAKAEQTPIAETKTTQEAIQTAKAKPSAQAQPVSQARSQQASTSAQTSKSLTSQKTIQQAVQPKEAQTTAKTNSVKPIAEEKSSPMNTNSAQPQPIKSQTPKQNLATAQAKAPTTEPSTTQTNNKALSTQQQSTNQQYISQQNISQQPVASTQPVMIKNANFLKTPVQPDYPRSARQRGQQGIVTYEVWLDENGRQIKQVLIKSSGISSLDRSALKAIKQWQFSPYTINNKGVPHRVQIPVNFKLDS